MGKIVELAVRKGCIRKGIRREYTLKAQIDDDAEIHVVRAELEGLIDGWLGPYIASETPKTVAVPKFDVKKFEQLFPEDMRGYLSFEDAGEHVKITPRQFLGAENFSKIAQIVREHGGDYVSKGKESHFILPKKW
ncbi:MAG: hypothetical protein QXJ31_05140 [Candidatus Bathyarchaeia archaeon]